MNRKAIVAVAAILVAVAVFIWVKFPKDASSPHFSSGPETHSSAQPIVTATPLAAQQPSASPTVVNDDAVWKGLVDQTWQRIPTLQQAEDSREQAGESYPHSAAAPSVRAAGRALGDLATYIDKNKTKPGTVDSGIEFFLQCARKEETHPTIRALCAANARNLALHVGKPNPLDRETLPESIRILADQIPHSW
ncbi:MAG: hypothetical protein JNL01_06895 [Bdellovibrionales bacterium]|nr:hypothetical protein [Bdellovibrionales bacterium]